MSMRFLGKNPQRKIVRPASSRIKYVNFVESNAKKVENNEKNDKEMDERLKKVEEIVKAKAPKRRVKVEKKDKGLIERTENSTILITEDNKMLLND